MNASGRMCAKGQSFHVSINGRNDTQIRQWNVSMCVRLRAPAQYQCFCGGGIKLNHRDKTVRQKKTIAGSKLLFVTEVNETNYKRFSLNFVRKACTTYILSLIYLLIALNSFWWIKKCRCSISPSFCWCRILSTFDEQVLEPISTCWILTPSILK